MLESINCPSCGASNQFPEGKTSMFCAFCGNSISIPQSVNSMQIESSIKVKPEISQRKIIKESKPKYDMSTNTMNYVDVETIVQEGGELSLINRNIKSFNELTYWFSDNELNEIIKLNLKNNNISKLEQLERFTSLRELNLSNNEFEYLNNNLKLIGDLEKINLSENRIVSVIGLSNIFVEKRIDLSRNNLTVLDDFPLESGHGIEIDLSFNSDLQSFSNLAIENLCNSKFDYGSRRIDIYLIGCNKFDFQSLSKLLSITNFYIWIYLEPNESSDILKNIGFGKVEKYCDTNKWTWRYPKIDEITPQKNNDKSNCFIATATMGSYDHPEVMELRNFRDNWILEKSWGERFVKWYYHYGQKASKSIEKSTVLKKISYILIVKPLVFISRLLK